MRRRNFLGVTLSSLIPARLSAWAVKSSATRPVGSPQAGVRADDAIIVDSTNLDIDGVMLVVAKLVDG